MTFRVQTKKIRLTRTRPAAEMASAELTPERSQALVDGILKSMQNGLGRDGEELKMLPSYVSKLGVYHGTFYALDLVTFFLLLLLSYRR